ncbi:MAG: hypothetical protein WB803_25215, partial [Pseudolabrys sp.]
GYVQGDLQMTAIRASISGPSRSANSNSVSIATCQSAASCSAFGSAVMYSAASRSVSSLRPSGRTTRLMPRRTNPAGIAI